MPSQPTVLRVEFAEPVSVGSGGLVGVTAVEVTADVMTFEGDHIAFWRTGEAMGRVPVSTLSRVVTLGAEDEDSGEPVTRRRADGRRWGNDEEGQQANGYLNESEVEYPVAQQT
jgi:hypothetical protein